MPLLFAARRRRVATAKTVTERATTRVPHNGSWIEAGRTQPEPKSEVGDRGLADTDIRSREGWRGTP
jgi:hypothetical protein